MKKLIVGTRGSKLAVRQSKIFIDRIKGIKPELEIEIKEIRTKGDRILDKPLSEIGGKNIFIGEIEKALLNGEIDLAIHSLKDMPAEIDSRFTLACYPPREDARDVFISREGIDLPQLPEGSILGSGSLRRQIQIIHNWPTVTFENIRGNVDTRIEKMKKRELSGLILAAAGLHRLGLEGLITRYISPQKCVPPAGQGTLGIEVLCENDQLIEVLEELDDLETRVVSYAERACLAALGGDCHLPIGVYGRIEDSKLILDGFLAADDGSSYLREKIVENIGLNDYNEGRISRISLERNSQKSGNKLASMILDKDGKEIL
ncbi:MAG: hydroxymethylbilane synthase [Firmicutes bacterium]|nr:hydroxymethylbilane synthase [Bacillota bacterium]